MKKGEVYKFEFEIFSLFLIAAVCSEVTVLLIGALKNAIEEIMIVYFNNVLFIARATFSDIASLFKEFSIFEYIIAFIVWFHVIFNKKSKCFLKINKAVSEMAEGNFKIRIDIKSEDKLGKLAANINKIMDEFNSTLEDEKRSEQTKMNLITSVSHDLRTPLTSILGYLQLIENDECKDEVALWYYVDIAYNKTKRLKVLIDDLFELTTLNNYGRKILKKEIDVVELINQLAIEYRLNFRKANIECRLDFTDEKVHILGDSTLLVRAFENLIFNCIKYSKTSDFMDVSVHKEDDKAVLRFINYGEPISPADIPYIFERFYRVEKSRSDKTGGSGLGLAIAKNIVELHGGEISAESSIHKTVFKIILPCI